MNNSAPPSSVRVTATIPLSDHEDMERIAMSKKVSTAWIIRDAISRYLDEESPLLRKSARQPSGKS